MALPGWRMTMFKFENKVKSHMPFAAPDPHNGFAPRLFCCIMIGGKWKIHQFKNGAWVRINTGLPEDATECSPAAECIDGVWHLTFVAGGAESSRMFRLYHICDLDAGSLPVILCPAQTCRQTLVVLQVMGSWQGISDTGIWTWRGEDIS